MQGIATFNSANQAIGYLQKKYGSTNYNQWQYVRYPYYSYVQYLTAGANILNFFGDSIGTNGVSRQFTNMPKASSFGQQHFLLMGIQCDLWLENWELNETVADDADAIYSDIVNGFVQCGALQLTIGGKLFAQAPKPFMTMPPAASRPRVRSAGLAALTLTEGAPNTLTSSRSGIAHAQLNEGPENMYVIDPAILIEAEQGFQMSIRFDSGAVPIIATDVVNNDTNPLYVGIIMDGIVIRPLQ
jgi:hypothetical protein